jgi:hypothetical protein
VAPLSDYCRVLDYCRGTLRVPSSKEETSMNSTRRPERRATRYPFAATAEATNSSDVRPASVKDLSVFGVYLAMPDPFYKGAVTVQLEQMFRLEQDQSLNVLI